LLRKKKKDDSAVSTEIEEAIIYNANQMKQLVDEILDFSRAGLVELKREHLDMKELFRSVFQELRALEEGRQIDFHLQDLPQTEGDPTLVRQAVSNLIGNALKYTRKEELATIKVWAEEKDGEMVYCIRDNGAGFDEAQKDKLFVAFQRLHTDSEFEGVGVGLSFVQKVIQRHGGKIWASGRPQPGRQFLFYLAYAMIVNTMAGRSHG
jgi:light-regulated signal transduction histidine kinase (bacteriophytochrome)